NAASAGGSEGTCASISSREPPGTRSNSPTAPLPPPVIASAALRPDACKAEINCCHAASDGLMVRLWSAAEKYLPKGGRQLGRSQHSCLGEENDERPAAAPSRRYRRRRGPVLHLAQFPA